MINYQRMPIEAESPEELGYDAVKYNLAESSVSDMPFKNLDISLDNISLEYGAHRGKKALRELLIKDQPGLQANDILITQGACEALFIIYTTILNKDNHLIVLHPNYATHMEVPKAMGCDMSMLPLRFENNWGLPFDELKNVIKENTVMISITNPHNPTGMMFREDEIQALIKFAKERNILLLIDETYRETFQENIKNFAACEGPSVMSVGSVSKAYGLPGLRIGWLITKNEILMEKFLAAKEMIHISNSVIDEELAYKFYLKKENFIPGIAQRTKQNREILGAWLMREKRIEMIWPEAGVVGFARIRKDSRVAINIFYKLLWEKYQTMVGPGHWFDMPDEYMRIGFGWPDPGICRQGLEHISFALDGATMP